MSDIDDRLLALVDSVVACDEQRLPLLTLREARAAIELLHLLSTSDGAGAYAARRFGNLRLNSHSQIRVHTGIGHDNRRDVYQDRRAYVWDNTRDTATLRNDHRRIVDAESWGRHGH